MTTAQVATAHPFELWPVSGALGAEIHGVQLAEVDDALFGSLRIAIREHLVLFFPDQHLTPEPLDRSPRCPHP